MAEGNGVTRFLGGFGQIITTILSALMLALLIWAWNLTQDVRLLMEGRDKVGRIEQILESARQVGRAQFGVTDNRLTRLEQVDAGRERQLAEIYAQLHDFDGNLNDARQEISALRATLQFLASRGLPPPER
jgi:hypothetical protein